MDALSLSPSRCLKGVVAYLIFPWWIHSKGNRMCEKSKDECVIPEGNHFPLLHLLLFWLLSDQVSRLMTILLQHWQIAVWVRVALVWRVSYKHPANFHSGHWGTIDLLCLYLIVWIVSPWPVNVCRALLDWFLARQWPWRRCCSGYYWR